MRWESLQGCLTMFKHASAIDVGCQYENSGTCCHEVALYICRLENGRYGHSPIRSYTSIQVYTTAYTDTSTPCIMVSQPLILLDQAGRLENKAYMQWVAHADH